MTCCVILHNMFIKNERDLNLEFFYDSIGSRVKPQRNLNHILAFFERYRHIENSAKYTQLNNDLIKHTMMPSLFMCEINNCLPSEPFVICLII
jgi:hypothetical protein